MGIFIKKTNINMNRRGCERTIDNIRHQTISHEQPEPPEF